MALISVSNNALSNISALPASIPTGALTLIKSITASASASIEFINGTNGVVLDNTYSSYIFSFVDIHPSVDNANSFQFNGSIDGGSNYNVTKTTTKFQAYHNEADNATGLNYSSATDLAQSTAFQVLNEGTNLSADNDHGGCGFIQLFNPSSTTYVKHFIARTNMISGADYALDVNIAGYFNTTSAINAIKFQMSSDNIDDGTIKLYGVK